MAKQVLVDLDFNSVARILNLQAAATGSEPVTLNQLNAAIEGLNWKDNARVASTTNLTLSGPGSAIDDITLTSGDRVLVKDQTTESENGIYVFNGAASAMTRAVDGSTFDEMENAVVLIDEGTANAGTSWRQTQTNGVIDTNDLIFESFLSASPDASETTKGIAEIATQSEVDTGTDDVRYITPLKLKNSKWFAQSKIFTIGDGSSTSFNCDHNLNTRNVQATVFRNSGSYDDVIVEVTRPSLDRVTVIFGAAPSTNAFIVVVQGQLTA